MKRQIILLFALALLGIIAVWQLNKKKDLLTAGKLQSAWADFTGSNDEPAAAVNNTSAGSTEEPEEVVGPPVADPAPEIAPGTPGEMFPFAAGTPVLEATVPMPEKRAPLVYFSYCGNSNDELTSASSIFGEFLKFQMRAQSSTETLMNLIPNSNMLTKVRRAYEEYPKQISRDVYLDDALDLACDYFIHPVFDGSTSQPQVTVTMVELGTSRTQTWSSGEAALNSVHDIIVRAAEEALRFAGYDEQVIRQNGISKGAPSNASFEWIATNHPDDFTYENMMALIANDQDCAYLYSTEKGSTTPLQLYDMGLQRNPEDIRLLTAKANTLDDAGSTDAMIRFTSEMVRRYPDNMYLYLTLGSRLSSAFPQTAPPRHTPPSYKVLAEQLGVVSRHYSGNRTLPWEHAYTLKSLGDYIRGGHTVDRITQHVWEERGKYISESYEIMKELVETRQDNPALVKALMYYDAEIGASDKHEQRAYIQKMADLDPRETEVEIAAAQTHSIGYGSPRDYFAFIDAAFKRHAGDPQATRDIVKAVEMELRRQIGWKTMSREEAYTSNNPYVNRFLDGAAFVYSSGLNLKFESDWAYYSVMQARRNQAVIDEWTTSGQNSYVCFLNAHEAHQAGDFERCLKYAQLGRPHFGNDDKGHMIRYYEIKSLWKLKRYEESLKAARDGIMAFPGEQTFPYMYAVVALEQGEHLETAYDCAWLAVSYGTDNVGCNEVFEKLRIKLNKPQHPALVAMAKQ